MPSPSLTRCALLCAVLFTWGTAEATNGLKLTAYGARAAGRGGVDYAYADDAIGPVNNPAGMAFTYGNRFDNNWALIIPKVEWTNSTGTYRNESTPFFPVPAFSFGVVWDSERISPFDWDIAPIFDMGSWGLFDEEGVEGEEGEPADIEEEFEDATEPQDIYGSSWKIGFGVFPITGGNIQMKDLNVEIPNPNSPPATLPAYSPPLDWETDILTVALTPSVAYRFSDHFAIGVSLQIIYSRFELDGGIAQPLNSLQEPFRSISPILSRGTQVTSGADIDDAFNFGFSWRVGAMFNSKYFSAGLIYQDKSYMQDYLGRTTVNANDEVDRLTDGTPTVLNILLQAVDPAADAANGFIGRYDMRIKGLESPRMIGFGVAFRPTRRFSVGLDYTWIHWSEVMHNFKARLTNGDNLNLDIMTGSTVHVSIPLDFIDQHVIAIGVTGLVLEGDDLVEGVPSFQIVLRAGYNYGNNPTPGDTTLPQQPTISEHHISMGFTFHWGPLVEINFAFDWALPSSLNTGADHYDVTLSNSKQEVEILFFHFGLSFNF